MRDLPPAMAYDCFEPVSALPPGPVIGDFVPPSTMLNVF